jgi:hypothetical protein
MSRAAPSRSHEPEAPPSSPRSPPTAHRRRSPPRNSAPSPWAAPSRPPLAKLNPYHENHQPPPVLNPPRTRNRATGGKPPSSFSGGRFSQRSADSPAVGPQRRFPPPSRWQVGPQATPSPSRPRRFPPSLVGRRWAESASARARARGGPKIVSPAQKRGILFSFYFPPFFPFK